MPLRCDSERMGKKLRERVKDFCKRRDGQMGREVNTGKKKKMEGGKRIIKEERMERNG